MQIEDRKAESTQLNLQWRNLIVKPNQCFVLINTSNYFKYHLEGQSIGV